MNDPFQQLAPFIQEYIRRERWDELRPVQLAAIPAILDADNHVLLSSGTASGKTEAAFLPIISALIEQPPESVGVLYISPLKALINDQFQRLDGLLEGSDIPVQGWHGDVAQGAKQRFLRKGRGILQITPESLESMLLRRQQDLGRLFHDLRFVVLDEVHALINSDRGRQVLCLLQRLERVQPRPPRRIGLSATIGAPERVGAWLAGGTGREVSLVEANAGRRLVHLGLEHFILATEGTTPGLYDHMAELVTAWPKTLVFVNTRADAEEVVYNLKRRRPEERNAGIHAHHGNVSATLREAAEADMRDETRHSCVAATVTLELGIDIGTLDQVLQLNTTSSVSSLVQRLGRSGRRNNPPRMFLYSTEDEPLPVSDPVRRIPWRMLQAIAIVQLYHEERWVEPPQIPDLPTSLLVQQTLSVLAAGHDMQPRDLAQRVLTLSPFMAVTTEQFRLLLQHLLRLDVLERSEIGELLIGQKGERIVSNWRFLATFETKVEYTVRAGAREIGSIQSLPTVGDVFRLAGRAWEVTELDPERRIIFVKQTRGRALATWTGAGPPLHRRIAQRLRQVLAEDTQYPWLQSNALQRLASARQLARTSRFDCVSLHDIGGASCLLLPWSGTREVDTLRRVLAWAGLEIKLVSWPYALEIRGASSRDLRERLRHLRDNMPDAGKLALHVTDEELPRDKFDRYVPEALLRAAWAADVLDVAGARQILEKTVSEE